jgi:DNA polymerase III alpha subunit (gram-positive type)
MRYVSIDVETTGLDPEENQLLEVGAVIEDTQVGGNIDRLPSFRAIIVHPEGEFRISPLVMRMHMSLFELIEQADQAKLDAYGHYTIDDAYYCRPSQLEQLFTIWLSTHKVWTTKGKIIPAGKNFFGFDYGFLKKWCSNIKFHHRHLDPVAYFTRHNDLEPPKLELCCERAGITLQNHHTAVGDAKTVVSLIRWGLDKCR